MRTGCLSICRGAARLGLVMPIAMVAVVAAVGLALDRSNGSRGRSDDLSALEPRQRAAFSVLSTTPEELPARMRTAIEATVEANALGLNLDLAQRVATDTGVGAWLVPGNGFVCIFRDETSSAVCDTTARAIKQGMTLVLYRPPARAGARPDGYLALGLAPDGVERVRMQAGASTTVVPVVDNVYALRARAPMRAELVR
jgi:hypothetical protein